MSDPSPPPPGHTSPQPQVDQLSSLSSRNPTPLVPVEEDVGTQVRSYERVLTFFVQEPVLLYALHVDPPHSADLDHWAKCLAGLSLYFNQVPDVFYLLFCFEAGRTPACLRTGGSFQKTQTFLRTTTVLSKALDAIAQSVLPDFICAVTGSVIQHVVREPRFLESKMELDASKGDEEECMRAADLQIELLEMFLKNFENAISEVNVVVRVLCREIVRIANQLGGDSTLMVSAFLLLRCLTPSLVVPERYNLLERLGLDKQQGVNKTRNQLLQFSRVLQKFANGRTFDEADNAAHQKVNSAFERLFPKYRQLIADFSAPSSPPPSPNSSTASLVSNTSAETSTLQLCHKLHVLLYNTASSLLKHVAHVAPQEDVHCIVNNVIALLPPPAKEVVAIVCPHGEETGSPLTVSPQEKRGGFEKDTSSNVSGTSGGMMSLIGRSFGHYFGGGSNSGVEKAEKAEKVRDTEDAVHRYERLLFQSYKPEGDILRKMRTITRLRCMRVVGMNRARVGVVQILPHRFPLADPSSLTQHALLLHFIKIMNGISKNSYSLVVLCESECGAKGFCMWMKKVYESHCLRRYSENLHSLHVLNPCLWTKGLVSVWNPIVGGTKSLFQRLHHTYSLTTLIENLKIDPKRFPVSRFLMKECSGVVAPALTGLSLGDALKLPGQGLRDYPALPYQCIAWLMQHGVHCKDLFTLSEELTECSLGGTEELSMIGTRGCASMLTRYLKELPGGLLGPQVMELCAAGADLCLPENGTPSKAPATSRIKHALCALPQAHLALTNDVFVLLHLIFIHSAETLLSPSALADILTHVIIPPDTSLCKSASPTIGEMTLMKYLIAQPPEYWKEIWAFVNDGPVVAKEGKEEEEDGNTK